MKSILIFLWHAGAALFWLGVAMLGFFYILFTYLGDVCQFDEYSRLESPDTDLTAVVLIQNCGATTNWRGMVTIEDGHGSAMRTVLTLEGHPRDSDLELQWHDGERLVLSHFGWEELVRVSPPTESESRFSVTYRAKEP